MRRKLLKIALATLIASLATPIAGVVAAGPTVTGAGSTWSQIAVDQWRADVNRFGIKINYQGVGSSAGRQFYINDQTDFAVSEIPFEANEKDALRQKGKSFIYMPILAGGTSLMYNLRNAAGQKVTSLQLSSNTIAKIFTRVITDWNHPQITADNGGNALPSKEITPVARSDGSGTSAQFTAYLWKREREVWCEFAEKRGVNPCSYTSNYPQAPGIVHQSGSDGVANYVHSESTGPGAITYVETGYALQRGRPVAAVKNASGAYVRPTSLAVSTALEKATLNSDRTQNLDAVYVNPNPKTYPISSYSYMIAQTKGFPTNKGEVLGKFILYFACEGQRKADQLGYSPLPKNLVQTVFEAERQIPGAPKPPNINDCDNPTIKGGAGSVSDSTGDALGGATGGTGGGGGGGGTGGGGSAGGADGGADAAAGGGRSGGGGDGGNSTSGDAGGGSGLVDENGVPLVGGTNDATNQALPDVDLTSKPPTWLPFAFAALLILVVIFVPPAFAIVGGAAGAVTKRYRKHARDAIVCRSCGAATAPGGRFCESCGFDLGGNGSALGREP